MLPFRCRYVSNYDNQRIETASFHNSLDSKYSVSFHTSQNGPQKAQNSSFQPSERRRIPHTQPFRNLAGCRRRLRPAIESKDYVLFSLL